jgi:hypothetical protein
VPGVPGSKPQPAPKIDSLTDSCESIVKKTWDPRRLKPLLVSTACYRDSSIFLFSFMFELSMLNLEKRKHEAKSVVKAEMFLQNEVRKYEMFLQNEVVKYEMFLQNEAWKYEMFFQNEAWKYEMFLQNEARKFEMFLQTFCTES